MKRIFVVLALFAFSAGCTAQPSSPSVAVYVGAAMTNQAELERSQAVIDGITHRLSDRDYLSIDVLSQEGLHTVYSSSVSPSEVRDLLLGLTSLPTSDDTLAKSVSRAATFCQQNKGHVVRAIFVTSGTANSQTLEKIQASALEMKGCSDLQVFLIGLDDGASSLALSTAFSPIRDRIRSARGDREWESMLDSL